MNRQISILFVFASTLTIFACQGVSSSRPTLSGNDLYLSVRNDAIEIKPYQLGMWVYISSTPYGVVMDSALSSTVTTTTVAYISGDASLLTSSGNGRVDGIKYENVRIAAKKFVSVAAGFPNKMNLTTNYPLPSLYHIRFYILTPNGIYSTDEINIDDLPSKRNPFYPLFLLNRM